MAFLVTPQTPSQKLIAHSIKDFFVLSKVLESGEFQTC